MFLTGTILNVITVLVGTVIGVLLGSRMPPRIQGALTDGLGLFVVVLGVSMGMSVLTDPAALPGDELAVLAAVLLGAAIGELLRLQDGLEALGGWFQDASRAGRAKPHRRSVHHGLDRVLRRPPHDPRVDRERPHGRDPVAGGQVLLDGVAAIAFAAALGWGVALSAITVLVVQGAIAGGAFLLRDVMDERTIIVVTAAGGVILLGVALRLLDLRQVRVASFLPALVLAPIFVRVADAIRSTLGG